MTADERTPADPAQRPRPAITLDNSFFWEGARQHELRLQSCERCDVVQFPPTSMCTSCGSTDLGWSLSAGRGTVYATAVVHHPPARGFDVPVLVALIELDEGARIVSNVIDIRREELQIGLPVEVAWLDSHPTIVEGAVDARGPVSLPLFRPRASQPAEEVAR